MVNIIKNLGANSIRTIINIFAQIVSVPLLIKYWGVDLYGEWIILNSIAAYFSMSDIGLNTVTVNDFVISYEQGKIERCKQLFVNNFYFIIIIFSVLYLGVIFLSGVVSLDSILNLQITGHQDIVLIMLLLTSKIFFKMVGNLYLSIYRAKSLNARSIMIDNFAYGLEVALLFCSVFLDYSLVLISLLTTLPYVIILFVKHIEASTLFPISFDSSRISLVVIKSLLIPSLSFMALPMGNAIILQGFPIFINSIFSPAIVVTFTTVRTLVNFIKSNFSLISNSIWPEISSAFGKKDQEALTDIFYKSVSVSIIISVIVGLGLLIFGPYVYEVWTKGTVKLDMVLFYIFILSILSNSIWYVGSTILAASNNHQSYSMYYLVSSFMALMIGVGIIKVTNSVSYIPGGLIVQDIIMIIVITIKVKNVLNINKYLSFISNTLSIIKKYK